MAGLPTPQDFPLHELVGQELINLSIGRHSLRLSFNQVKIVVAGQAKYSDGAGIDIEAGFEFQMAGGEVVKAENANLAAAAASLIPLLGVSITAVDRQPNNELRLQFGEATVLLLTVDAQGYESYHLHVGGHSIDVTTAW